MYKHKRTYWQEKGKLDKNRILQKISLNEYGLSRRFFVSVLISIIFEDVDDNRSAITVDVQQGKRYVGYENALLYHEKRFR